MSKTIGYEIYSVSLENEMSLWSKTIAPDKHCLFIYLFEEAPLEDLVELEIITRAEAEIYSDQDFSFIVIASLDAELINNMAWKLNDAGIGASTYFNGLPT